LTDPRGLGRDVILRFLEGVHRFDAGTVQAQLANLKASGDYARIIGEVTAEIEEENREALRRAEKAEQARIEAERREAEAAAERERRRIEAEQRAKEAEAKRRAAIEEAERRAKEAERLRAKAAAEAKAAPRRHYRSAIRAGVVVPVCRARPGRPGRALARARLAPGVGSVRLRAAEGGGGAKGKLMVKVREARCGGNPRIIEGGAVRHAAPAVPVARRYIVSRDGKCVDSFLSKTAAMRAARELAGDDAVIFEPNALRAYRPKAKRVETGDA
jgi:hypothetical protein